MGKVNKKQKHFEKLEEQKIRLQKRELMLQELKQHYESTLAVLNELINQG